MFVAELDFRFRLGAPIHGIRAFLATTQLKLLTFLSYFECGRLQNGKLCRLMLTLQLRYNGWVTELQDLEISRQLTGAVGLDNLLYTPDADFSCFADLALTSPEDYYIEGQGSLIQ
ncbi:hypothetical protein GW17_00025614 [Ensete ventricosum]|uniref:Uncharacterized protein n=1 Tax=Ensete ventricosum TaxID=4639 RepID=A0A444EK99_ENSVE|nr:hypothetical protein B296_00016479 [Ensete ventricosum]RWW10828.1 hypothetical protein GW17_00025614 [Ensete ventricosum]RZS14347.1 hypothetical protein BHM03_00046028 [Ensete ventricosum]